MKSVPQLEDEIDQLRNELSKLRTHQDRCALERYEQENKLSITLGDDSDGLWDWDLTTDQVYYSPRWKSMLGYEDHELAHTLDTWASMVHPDDKDVVLEKLNHYLNNKSKAFEAEMRMLHKQGYYLFIRTRALQVTRNANHLPVRIVGTHVDITQQKKAELFEKQHTHILKMIAQGTSASKIYNEIARIYEARHNGIRCSMLELDGNRLLHGGAPSLPKEYCEQVHGLINGPNVGSCGTSTYTGKRVVVENIATDHKWADIKDAALPHGMRSCWSEPIISSTGKVLGAFGMYRDYPSVPDDEESHDLTAAARLTSIVMERDHNQKRIQTLAYNDELTGLSSRVHLFLNIEALIKASYRYNEPFSLLYLDLDNFKGVNDSLGHDIGDYLLTQIAERIVEVSREADCVARLGGDEFCIVVKDITESYNAATIAQRAIDIISTPITLAGRHFIPACSIGIARYPDDGDDLKSLLKAADTALYAAKDAGKGCYAFYNVELSRAAEYHFKVEQYLREAIEKKQLSLVYQPQIDIKTGRILGVEVLSRWHHPELGDVSPVEFIGLAEQIGMIKTFTEWILIQACTQAVAWRELGYDNIRVSVNISPSHLFDHDFIPTLKKIIQATGMQSHYLELEVTENIVQTDNKNFSVFKQLKDLGVLLAIDDFGTGYSSFASLKHLTVDYLKLDKYFIDDMLKDNKTYLLVSSMIKMGHNLGYQIVAEGIETIEQYHEIKRLHCDTAQGFLFSKPVKADEISILLENAICYK